MKTNTTKIAMLLAVLIVSATMSGCIEDTPEVIVPEVIVPEVIVPEVIVPEVIKEVVSQVINTEKTIVIDESVDNITVTGYIKYVNDEFTELLYNYSYTNNSNDIELYIKGEITQKYGNEPICNSVYGWKIHDPYLTLAYQITMVGSFSNVKQVDSESTEYHNILPENFNVNEPITLNAAIDPFFT